MKPQHFKTPETLSNLRAAYDREVHFSLPYGRGEEDLSDLGAACCVAGGILSHKPSEVTCPTCRHNMYCERPIGWSVSTLTPPIRKVRL